LSIIIYLKCLKKRRLKPAATNNFTKEIQRLLFFCFLLFLSACAVNPVTGQKEFMLMSEQMEIDWGNSVYPNAVWGEVGGGGRYYDSELERYLSQTVNKLNAVSHRSNLPVDFIIQNSSVPNAWAIPGHVAMTRGLVANLENEEQFAFVMGHEMGHVAARHSAAQMSRSILVQVGLVATGIALENKKNTEWILGAGAIGANLFLLKYSRDQELQADSLGTLYMAKTGYDPNEAITAHYRLDKVVDEYMKMAGKQSREATFLDELLSTHPPTKDRVATIKGTISTMQPYQRSGDGKNAHTFQQMTAKIKRSHIAYLRYDVALKNYREDRTADAEYNLNQAFQIDENQSPFYNLRGLIELKKNRIYEARTNFSRAIEIDRNYQPAYHSMGFSYYLERNYQTALSYLNQSLKIYPDNIASHYFAGMSYYRLKDYENAAKHLEPFASANSKHNEIHGILGICYDQTNERESAYQEYRKQVEAAPNSELGRHAAERISALEQIFRKEKEEEEKKKKKK
jgi:predicted Zn-dependent protease